MQLGANSVRFGRVSQAKASNGEICCTRNPDGTCDYDAVGDCRSGRRDGPGASRSKLSRFGLPCSDGIKEYETEFIDQLVAILRKYDGVVPISLVIEPDSLPNLVDTRSR